MARPGDRTAVDRLVVDHLPSALRFALRLTGDADTAEEVVQEAVCLVLRRWPSYRGDAAFGTWMLRIVLNVDRDRRRRRRSVLAELDGEEASHAASPVDWALAGELHARAREAIDRLPRRQREVLLLSFGEGLAAGDIARVLETTEANVHSCLYLARKRLAKSLGVDPARPRPT
jgi:RNA polymerase sigma-70 factor (ECF subfamily)